MKLLRKMIRDEWLKVVSFTIFMSAVSVAQVIFWPEVEKVIIVIRDIVPEFLQWMTGGIASEGFSFYLITQQLLKNIGIFGSALAVLLGASAVAKERELGTLELLLAQPVSRTRFLTEKFFFNAVVLALPILISNMLVYPSSFLVGESIDPAVLLVSGLYCFSVLLVVFAFTFFLGIFLEDQMQVISTGVGACLVMMLLIIFDQTKPFSLYGYLEVEHLRPIFRAGRVPYLESLTFVVISLGFLSLSIFSFRKHTV